MTRWEAPVWGRRAMWQIRLRWFVPPAILTGVVVGRLLGFGFEAVPIVLTAAFIQTYNVVLWLALSRHAGIYRAERVSPAVVEVVLDYLSMFVLVHYTGGAASPLVLIFPFHVVFAAIVLETRLAWAFAVAVLGGMVLLTAAEAVGLVPIHAIVLPGGQVDLAGPARAALVLPFLGLSVLVAAGVTSALVARLRQESSRTIAALEAVADERSRVMRLVAHNLRSPLAAAVSMIDLLRGGYAGELNDDQARYLDRARGRIAALNDLIGELLALARVREPTSPATALVDVAALARSVADEYTAQALERGLVLDLPDPDSTATVRGDEAGLRQVAENLVSNALKYTPRGGTVAVTVSPENGWVRLVVRDTGIGIPESELPRLFGEFFRASNARRLAVDGTGLGLALVRQTVERHGGRVSVESAEGAGTAFTVELPAADPDPPGRAG